MLTDAPHVILNKCITKSYIFNNEGVDLLQNYYLYFLHMLLDEEELESQSGVVSDSDPAPGTRESEVAPMSKEQITSFADQDAGWVTEKVGMYEPTMDLANNNDSELGNFLKRPIRQSAQTWLVGQPFFYKFNPWTAFCEKIGRAHV